jgi:hypothetical protein
MTNLTATDIEVALQQTSSHADSGTAGALLRGLLDYVRDECVQDDASDIYDVLAAKGSQWHREFGLSISEDEDGELTIEWGFGDSFSWCTLQDVLDACALGDFVPGWWDNEWTVRPVAETTDHAYDDVLFEQDLA